MILYIYEKNIIKTLNCRCFQSVFFYFGHFFILCNRDYGIHILNYELNNVRTNTKYTSHVISF